MPSKGITDKDKHTTVRNRRTGFTCEILAVGVLFVKLGIDGSVYKWVRIPVFRRDWEEVK